MDLVRDQARTEVEQRLDLGGIGRRLRSGAQVGRVAVVFAQRRAAPEIDLQRLFVPVRGDPEHLVEPLPAQDGRKGRSHAANVHRAPTVVLRPKPDRIEGRDEAGEVRHGRTLASSLRACRETQCVRREAATSRRPRERRALTRGLAPCFLRRMVHGEDFGLPVRAALHPTGLYLALRNICACGAARCIHAGNRRARPRDRDVRARRPGRPGQGGCRQRSGRHRVPRRALWIDADFAVAAPAVGGCSRLFRAFAVQRAAAAAAPVPASRTGRRVALGRRGVRAPRRQAVCFEIEQLEHAVLRHRGRGLPVDALGVERARSSSKSAYH